MSSPSDDGLGMRQVKLRNRLAVQVGLLVAALAATLGLATYAYVREALLDEIERNTAEQFTTNVQVVRSALRSIEVDEVALLSSLRPDVRASELLYTDGAWFTDSLRVQPADLPPALVDLVDDGHSAQQHLTVRGSQVLAIGTPLDEGDRYFEVVSLDGLQRTLSALRTGLIAGGVFATLLGAGVALLVGQATVGPLEQVSRAAARLADGNLGARLDPRREEELAQITTSFNRMADALQERIERESRFAADVSHELRSPLTTVVNAVSVLQRRRAELSPDGQEALALLAADVHRFERTIGDLIEIAKLDAGSIPATLEDQDLEQAVRTVLRRLRKDDVSVIVGQGAADAHVRIEMRRFELAINNVLRNADHYAGGVVAVLLEVDGTNARMLFDDEGPGIPQSERERVFERFARGTHGERRSTPDGSGLGLSLVRELLRSMGGDAWAVGRQGEAGARIVLELPRSDR